jgi:RepB DNA-primase from phage plasmid
MRPAARSRTIVSFRDVKSVLSVSLSERNYTRRPFAYKTSLEWATQLGHAATVRFLRMRNREGCDIYVQPYTEHGNAGYILVDLDRTRSAVIESMRANGHDPCVVLRTGPGHLQAWTHLIASPLEPALATAAGKQLARIYGGELASTDWRHLGRLAGFTNQKPQRRTPGGYASWVRIVYTRVGLARNADGLLQSVIQLPALTQGTSPEKPGACAGRLQNTVPPSIAAAEATRIYQDWMQQWPITERFSAAGLERRGFPDRQPVAVAGYTRRPGPSYSPTRQPTLSPPPN